LNSVKKFKGYLHKLEAQGLFLLVESTS